MEFKSLTILICVWLEEESQTSVEKRNCSNCRKCLPIITENKFSLREQSFRREYGTKLVLGGKNVKAKKSFQYSNLVLLSGTVVTCIN